MPHLDTTREKFRAFRAFQRDGPINMLNLVRLRDQAIYPDDIGHGPVTGAEAYAAYGRESAPIMEKVGGRVVWRAAMELMLIGPDDDEQWDHMFIVEYPSVDAFVAMVKDPDYQNAVIHRIAAVADSRLVRTRPLSAGANFADAGD
ncbi:DUF1330 domain-containing protein [Chachezhania antarctica]|uniref:DUF1330 domain-containing protein n=1 Tax=Chachezhania antarctica TaxID=2340860 RepID=UPI000EADD837|nr:DUF1330 domain-containing protein [Chachezhania antarctica]